MVGQKVGSMLKITIHEAADPLRIELEGRLAGASGYELEHCWHTAQARHPNRTLAVDLTGVTFIDQAGRYLLQWMHRDGVRLVGSALLLQDLLDHLRGSTA
jgi:anti-anti-sigma regulatory factor